jgi:hypothetical protein
MNAERLHIVAATLREELRARSIIDKLQALTTSLQSFVQQNNANTQQTLVNSREAFYEAVSDTPSDSFTPAWRQILVEMGGEELFGRKLKQWVQQLIADNVMTPGPAYEQISEILTKLQAFKAALDQLVMALESFNIGSEELAPGEAEIALLIPREAVNDKLGDFADELNEMGFILNTFSEVVTGHPDDLIIRTVSSSGLMVFLAAHPKFAATIAKIIDFVVKQYKRILEIKKLHGEIERLQLPDEISEKTKEYANTQMDAAIEKFSVEFINESYTGTDGGRKNELRNAVRVSLNMVANRIDRGFNFEVRIQPPEAAGTDAAAKQAVQAIQAASVSMQYMKLEGPPILALPEKPETAEGEAKSKKRIPPKKAEPK